MPSNVFFLVFICRTPVVNGLTKIETVSAPKLFSTACLTTVLWTFPFGLTDAFLSQITLAILLHPLLPSCTLFFTALAPFKLLWSLDPKYQDSSTLTGTILPLSLSLPYKYTFSSSCWLPFLFCPVHVSTSRGFSQLAAVSHYKSLYLQTSHSIKTPAWSHLSTYPSDLTYVLLCHSQVCHTVRNSSLSILWEAFSRSTSTV